MESLAELLEDQVKDLYNAETQLTSALPKMVKAAFTPELKKTIEAHLKETQTHVQRLKDVASELDISPSGKTCAAMKGLIEEGKEAISDGEQGPVRDAAIVAAAQRVEHYEIAAYGTARALAQQLGLDKLAKILDQTLQEEGAADHKLSEVVEDSIYSVLSSEKASDEEQGASSKGGRGSRERSSVADDEEAEDMQ